MGLRIGMTVPSLSPDFGGPIGQAVELAGTLKRLGHQVRLLGVGDVRPLPLDWITGIPALGRFHATPIPTSLEPIRQLVEWCEVLHVIGYRDPVGTYASYVASQHSKPIVFEPVGMLSPKLRSFKLKALFDALLGNRVVVRNADVVIATSSLEREEMAHTVTSPVALRPVGIDVSSLEPLPPRGAMRRDLRVPADAPLVLALGRIAAIKGLETAVEACARLSEVWLLIIGPDEGDGTLRRVEEEARALDLERRLRIMARFVSRGDLAQVFADADILIQPSLTESFGRSAAEAASLGLPVVVTETCGVAEWLATGSARIVAPRNAQQLADAINKSLTAEASQMARRSADLTRERLGWNRLAVLQAEIYQEVTSPSIAGTNGAAQFESGCPGLD